MISGLAYVPKSPIIISKMKRVTHGTVKNYPAVTSTRRDQSRLPAPRGFAKFARFEMHSKRFNAGRVLEVIRRVVEAPPLCQLRILIAATQASAKLQSAKSTEDENTEGKANTIGATQTSLRIYYPLFRSRFSSAPPCRTPLGGNSVDLAPFFFFFF